MRSGENSFAMAKRVWAGSATSSRWRVTTFAVSPRSTRIRGDVVFRMSTLRTIGLSVFHVVFIRLARCFARPDEERTMNVYAVRRRQMRRLIPLSVACCLGAFCAQPVAEMRVPPAARVQRADAVWPRAATIDRMPLAAR
jgi:hypothetical protein